MTRDHKSVSGPGAKNAVIGVWSTTERPRLTVLTAHGAKPKGKGDIQVSRLGNPLINEVIIPLAHKIRYDGAAPDRDAALYGKYALEPRAGTSAQRPVRARRQDDQPDGHRHGAAVRHPRQDPDLHGRGAGRHAEGQPRRAAHPARQAEAVGVLGGDLGGFPKGAASVTTRRHRATVVGGAWSAKLPLGDGVDQNDKQFRRRSVRRSAAQRVPLVAEAHRAGGPPPTAKDGLF